MITIRFYGLLRLDAGVREMTVAASTVAELFALISRQNPRITKKDLEGCVLLINGKVRNRRAKLADGDVVQLMPPVAGG